MAVPLHFTIEFFAFLVAAGGAILVVSRPDLVPGAAMNRVTAAIGFGAISVSQVLHGGNFGGAEGDTAEILIGLRTLGIAFVLIGVVGGLRAGASAAVTVKLEEPLMVAPAAAALLLAVVAGASARRNAPRSMYRLSMAALLLAASEVLLALTPPGDVQFGTGAVSSYSAAAHGVKALAFLALTWWLWSSVRSSIRTRFVASFALLLVAVVLALSSALTGLISRDVQDEELNRVRAQADAAVAEIEGAQEADLNQDVKEIANLASVQAALTGGNAEGVARDLREVGIFELDFVMLMDEQGRVLGFDGTGPHVGSGRRTRATKLSRLDILTDINGSRLVSEVVDGIDFSISPTQLGGDAIALMGVREVAQGNDRIGIVAAGRYIDALTAQAIAETLKAPRVSIVVGRRLVGTDLPGRPKASEVLPRDVANELASTGRPVKQQVIIDGRSYSSAYAQISNERGAPIGTLVLSTPARVVIQAREGFVSILFATAMAVGAIALLLAWLGGRRITRPIQDLTATASAIRGGDLRAQAPVEGHDEVGRLGETFNEMTASLFKMTDDLREAAREEHRLRGRIETIIQSMADGLVAVGADKKILAFNREAEQLTGVKVDEAIGMPIHEVLDVRDVQRHKVHVPIYDLTEGSADGIYVVRKGGDLIPVAIVSALLRGEEGDVAGGVAVLRDMTREREVERMKTEFLSNISHELRTPLTPIKGYAEILSRPEIPAEKGRKFAEGILESTARLERIVELLVDFSAMEAGRLSPRTSPVEIGPMLQALADEWKIRSPRHDVVTEVTEGLPSVSGDERLLRRSIEEVIDNAVKFSPHGGTIRLRASDANSSNGRPARETIQVTVSDEGIGISPEDIPRIFSDFHQLDGSETRSYGGLGLGLAFVRRIIEAHDGSMSVESELDRGTTMTITIPATAEVLED